MTAVTTPDRTLVVVSAGLGQPSSTRLLADQLAAATGRELHARGVRTTTESIEIRQYAHDVVNTMLTGFPPDRLKLVCDLMARADGLIAVTPVFKASYNGFFKSFFDVLDEAVLVEKPVLIAATGGTTRHSLILEHAMRPLFSYMQAVVVPTGVYAAAEDWGNSSGDGTPGGALTSRLDRAARELADLMAAREVRHAVDPLENPTPFEQLLPGGRDKGGSG